MKIEQFLGKAVNRVFKFLVTRWFMVILLGILWVVDIKSIYPLIPSPDTHHTLFHLIVLGLLSMGFVVRWALKD